ncbi:MAG: 2-oxo acid dehydrogenase subunit E2 [Anaerolineae bacterium]|nr:2-oxo acid dehydrogenase subunit E2 [Anaerolineae bacterium]
MPTNILMPQLGESVVEGTVSRWLKQIGDPVDAFEPLLEVSTDKVETEIPAPVAGVLLSIQVEAGKTVAKGTVLGVIGAADEALPEAEAAGHGDVTQPMRATQETPVASPAAPTPSGNGGWHVTPVVARMAAEHALDLAQIQGSGHGGRVTKKDVEAYLETREAPASAASAPSFAVDAEAPAPWETPGSGDLFKPTDAPPARSTPATKPSAPVVTSQPLAPAPTTSVNTAEGELVGLSLMRKGIAEHMVMSKLHTAPHVTTVFEVDLSAVLAHQAENKDAFARQGVGLTLTAYFVAASVTALRATPYINAEWRDEGIFLHERIHIGLAVALDEGLIVPVLRNAQDLNLLGIARGINDLAARARSKKLSADETRGGTFTLSNHGVSGSLIATPIINQPQTGILGVGLMEQRVKVIDGMIAIRPCAYVSLTFDHRVTDGATGDRFMQILKGKLEAWED